MLAAFTMRIPDPSGPRNRRFFRRISTWSRWATSWYTKSTPERAPAYASGAAGMTFSVTRSRPSVNTRETPRGRSSTTPSQPRVGLEGWRRTFERKPYTGAGISPARRGGRDERCGPNGPGSVAEHPDERDGTLGEDREVPAAGPPARGHRLGRGPDVPRAVVNRVRTAEGRPEAR